MTVSYTRNIADANASQNEILGSYRGKVAALQANLVGSQLRQSRALIAFVGSVLLLIFLLSANVARPKIPLFFSAIPLIGSFVVFRRYERLKGISLRLAHRSGFYERGIDRLTAAWHGKGVTGLEFARSKHLYQWDLDIIGEGSLFELLCTTRSEVGAERLACYLLDPVSLEEARSRQSAVKELIEAISLREEIALLGKYNFQDCSHQRLHKWLEMPILKVHRAIWIFLFISAPTCAVLGILGLTALMGWSTLTPFLIPFAIVQITIAAVLSRRVRPQLKILETLSNEFIVLWQGLEIMQRLQFQSPKLQSLVQLARHQDASSQIRKLERLVSRVNYRKIDTVYLPSLLLAVGTQLVLAVERWRAEQQEYLKMWLDCWAEFEALNALACYAYEHPAHVLPDLVEGAATFEGTNLGHPLLSTDICIGNDVALNDETRFYLISGSNMAGKSTFLRAIGVNSVLAAAGTSVQATSARMSIFTVCASISITDSILEGKSKFLAEVERLKETIGSTYGSKPVLFLIDEILGGTNSTDRRIIAKSVIETLITGRAIGAFSTHDLALCEIAKASDFRGVNLYMESENPNDPLDFDYRIKTGISLRSNALAIVRMLGIIGRH